MASRVADLARRPGRKHRSYRFAPARHSGDVGGCGELATTLHRPHARSRLALNETFPQP
jgi:hypothetical protein